MITAPSTAPGIVPMPPANEVPPMTAAEITSSSLVHAEVGDGGVEAGRLHRRADRAQDAHQDEREHDRPAHVDAAQLGGLRVAADGVDVAAEPSPPGEVRHHEGHADQDHHRVGDAGRDLQPAGRFDDAVPFGVLAGELRRPGVAVGDPDRAEDDETTDHAEPDVDAERANGELVADGGAAGPSRC